jgi:hypothetical protein
MSLTNNTRKIKIPNKGKYALEVSKGVTRKQALNKWVAGYMEGARKHPSLYHKNGIKTLMFVNGKTKISRKI